MSPSQQTLDSIMNYAEKAVAELSPQVWSANAFNVILSASRRIFLWPKKSVTVF
jgi:hypothetical protein